MEAAEEEATNQVRCYDDAFFWINGGAIPDHERGGYHWEIEAGVPATDGPNSLEENRKHVQKVSRWKLIFCLVDLVFLHKIPEVIVSSKPCGKGE